MARKIVSGLVRRGAVWHIDKIIRGRRVCESTGESDVQRAEEFLSRRIEEVRQAQIFGVSPKRTFKHAATKYLNEATKASISRDSALLKILERFIGNSSLESLHMGTLQTYIEDRRKATRTINYGLQVVRRILNLAAGEWMDEYGLSWLAHAPKIKLLRERRQDGTLPYVLGRTREAVQCTPETFRQDGAV